MNMNYVRFPDVFFVARHVGFGIHFEEATNAFVTFMTCAIHATLLIVKPPKCGKSVGGLHEKPFNVEILARW